MYNMCIFWDSYGPQVLHGSSSISREKGDKYDIHTWISYKLQKIKCAAIITTSLPADSVLGFSTTIARFLLFCRRFDRFNDNELGRNTLILLLYRTLQVVCSHIIHLLMWRIKQYETNNLAVKEKYAYKHRPGGERCAAVKRREGPFR